MDKRAAFFVIAAAACAALYPLIPDDPAKPWIPRVGIGLVFAYALMAVASYADHRSRSNGRK